MKCVISFYSHVYICTCQCLHITFNLMAYVIYELVRGCIHTSVFACVCLRLYACPCGFGDVEHDQDPRAFLTHVLNKLHLY